VGTHPAIRSPLIRRGAAAAVAVLTAAGLIMTAGAAGAEPQPSVSQVKAKINKLTAQENVLIQRYDQVSQELSSAKQRLKLVDQAVTRDKVTMQNMQGAIGGIASAAYMNGSLNSPLGILTSTSSSAQTVMEQSAFLTKLSTSEQQQLAQGNLVANALSDAKASVQRTESAVATLQKDLKGQKDNLEKLITKQKGILSTLTAQQQTTLIGGGPVTTPTNTVPTNTQAGKAVAFAFAQLGCPYVFGGTGPCGAGFDCSGLTMQAWAAAGVAIPRTSEAQAGLPAVPTSALQPGDILEFAGDSHVGIYVGGGMLIDAPQPGENVEEVSLSNSWYSSNLDGAVRP
jgi:cell wall-associated NlpC family hydrolase